MSPVYSIAVYIIIWWTVLFIVLPWGVTPTAEQENANPLHDPGAPVKPHLKQKLLATTLISALLLGIIYYLSTLGITVRSIFSP